MTVVMGGVPHAVPGSDRILVELFQILKDDAVESAALNMQYASSQHQSKEFVKVKALDSGLACSRRQM